MVDVLKIANGTRPGNGAKCFAGERIEPHIYMSFDRARSCLLKSSSHMTRGLSDRTPIPEMP